MQWPWHSVTKVLNGGQDALNSGFFGSSFNEAKISKIGLILNRKLVLKSGRKNGQISHGAGPSSRPKKLKIKYSFKPTPQTFLTSLSHMSHLRHYKFFSTLYNFDIFLGRGGESLNSQNAKCAVRNEIITHT